MSLYKHVNDVIGAPAAIPHNVPAVCEVGGGIQGLCGAKTAAANLPE